ncbi:MAG: type II secretion system F family protein [Phycisphaerales bacterium]|nr:type II secretion system F family protein [Phycisphaerales bacterium]
MTRMVPTPFLFVAARPDGGRRLGFRRARDRRHLADQLRRERLVPLRTWSIPSWASPESKVSLKDQAELHFQFAQLLSRGVPLVEALDVTSQAVAAATRPRVERIRELVAGGTSFAEACRSVEVFDPVTIAVYRAAERSGDLAGAAKQLAETTRRQLAISGKVTMLMTYPAVVLTISILVSLLLIVIVVPQIGQSLASSGVELPWITRALVGTGLFLRAYGLWVGVGVLGLIVGAVIARRRVGAFIMRGARLLPAMREVIVAQESSRFFTVMAAMTRTGVTLADALGVAVGVVGHPELKNQLSSLRTRLIEGGLLRSLIDSVTALPMPTRRLLIAAERSGDMESAFGTLAQDMTEELDRRSGKLLALLEPLLTVLMFLIIGSLLLSIMIPLIRSTAQMAGG